MTKRWVRWAAVLGWMALIFFLSAQPRLPQIVPSLFDAFQDVLGHFAAYAILAALLHAALAATGVRRPALWALLIVLLYALSDEYHQSFVPGRHPDPFDILTDLAGACVVLLVLSLRRCRPRRPPS